MKGFFESLNPGSCHRAQWNFKRVCTPFLSYASITQPPESEFSIIKIEFLIYVVKVGITDPLCFDSHQYS